MVVVVSYNGQFLKKKKAQNHCLNIDSYIGVKGNL